ncbi:MAG: site-specific integrase [Bacteroidota bacterium]
MKTNILISLDTRRPKADGSYPLVMRIGHKRRTATIQLGYDIKKKDWDAKKRMVRKSYTGVSSFTRLNHRLSKIKTELFEIIRELEENEQLAKMSATDIKNFYLRNDENSSFLAYGSRLVQDLKIMNKIGTAQSYYTTINALKNFLAIKGKSELTFLQVDYSFLKSFEKAHLAKGNTLNGLGVYMRTIRAIYNKAIKEGLVDRKYYPFHDYKIKTEPTRKRAIPIEEIQKILHLDLEDTTKLFHYRNYFLTSYFLWGISFMDLAYLKVGDIQGERITYRRRKTGKLYDIKISKPLQEILSYYCQDKGKDDYIFPVLRREAIEDQYREIKWERKRYNDGLRKLAHMCGIEHHLTSYVVRHSFATQALLNEIPLKAISEMLGHSSLTTTQIYLKSLPSNVLDSYADRLGLE